MPNRPLDAVRRWSRSIICAHTLLRGDGVNLEAGESHPDDFAHFYAILDARWREKVLDSKPYFAHKRR
jgi:hypothetical protein